MLIGKYIRKFSHLGSSITAVNISNWYHLRNIMAKAKKLEEFERSRIIELQMKGLSQRAIPCEIGCRKASVANFVVINQENFVGIEQEDSTGCPADHRTKLKLLWTQNAAQKQ